MEGKLSCPIIPRRYLLAVVASVATVLTIGTRAFFALVLTHLTASSGTNSTNDIFFSDCTALNVSLDMVVDIEESVELLLHAAYFAGYFLSFPCSILSTLISPVRVLGLQVLTHSIITMCLPSAIVSNVPLIFVLRVAQGLTEGSQQPIIIGLLSAWSTEQNKASLMGILWAGVYFAPSLAFLLATTCICYVDWSAIFYIYGVSGVVWAVVWVCHFYDKPQQDPSLSESERCYHEIHGTTVKESSLSVLRSIPWREMLKCPSVWCCILASFTRMMVFSAMIVLQPQYFQDSFNLNAADIGLLAMAPNLPLSAFCLIGGVASDRLMRCGLSKTCTRKLAYTTGALIEGLCLVGLYFANDWTTAILLLFLGVSMGGLATAGYSPLVADIAPQYAGVIFGLSQLGSSGAIASTVLAYTMSGTTQATTTWQQLFLLFSCMQLGMVVIFDIFADARQQPWATGVTSRGVLRIYGDAHSLGLSNRRDNRGNQRDHHHPIGTAGQCADVDEETLLLYE